MNLSDFPDGTLFLQNDTFLGVKIGTAKIIWKHLTKKYEVIASTSLSLRFGDMSEPVSRQIKVLFKPSHK